MQRQRQQRPDARIGQVLATQALEICQKVLVGERDALGKPCRPGCVKEDGGV
jgi:hypothetical protein